MLGDLKFFIIIRRWSASRATRAHSKAPSLRSFRCTISTRLVCKLIPWLFKYWQKWCVSTTAVLVRVWSTQSSHKPTMLSVKDKCVFQLFNVQSMMSETAWHNIYLWSNYLGKYCITLYSVNILSLFISLALTKYWMNLLKYLFR